MKKEFIEDIKNGREDKFYNSWTWRKKRLEIIENQNNECQHCKLEGGVTIGTKKHPLYVHHIEHIKNRPDLIFDTDNLITLCHFHHELQHPEKLKKHRGEKKEIINKEKW